MNATAVARDLYEVDFDSVIVADPGFGKDSDVKFHNPRFSLGTKDAVGLDRESMNELKESIRSQGLFNPLVCRQVDDSIILVAGERRYRAIASLIQKNELCFDPGTDKMVPAKELYGKIQCRIRKLNDIEALTEAFAENDRAKNIGEGATVGFVKYLRNHGCDSETILAITGKSISWLADTDLLVGLDEKTFESLAKNEINRSAALELVKIEDIEERVSRLEDARQRLNARIGKLKASATKALQKAKQKVELAEAEADVAKIVGEGSEEAEQKIAKAKQKAQKKQEHVSKIDGKAKITTKDIRGAAKDAGVEEKKPLTSVKIRKMWLDPLTNIIRKNFKDEEGESIEMDQEDAHLTQLVVKSLMKGEADFMRVLRQHERNRERRNSK